MSDIKLPVPPTDVDPGEIQKLQGSGWIMGSPVIKMSAPRFKES